MSLKKNFAIIFYSVIMSKPLCGQCRDCFDHTLGSEFSVTLFFETKNESQASLNLDCGF